MKKLTTVFLITLLLISCASFSLSGCTPRVTFIPENLPIAVVGETYKTSIEIKGGGVGISSSSFYIDISPINALNVEVIHVPEPYSSIQIYGKPEAAGDIKIQIFGNTLGTSFSGKEFEKTYIIKVKESE